MVGGMVGLVGAWEGEGSEGEVVEEMVEDSEVLEVEDSMGPVVLEEEGVVDSVVVDSVVAVRQEEVILVAVDLEEMISMEEALEMVDLAEMTLVEEEEVVADLATLEDGEEAVVLILVEQEALMAVMGLEMVEQMISETAV